MQAAEADLARSIGAKTCRPLHPISLSPKEAVLVAAYPGLGTFVTIRIDYVVSAENPPSRHKTARLAGARPRAQTLQIELAARA